MRGGPSAVDSPADSERAREWGLGPLLRGSFKRSVTQIILWVALPTQVFFTLVYWWVTTTHSVPTGFAIAVLLVGGTLANAGMVWLTLSLGYAAAIQVGDRGVVTINRKYFGGGLRSFAWIDWGDVVLTPGSDRGNKFSRTVGVRPRGHPGAGLQVDYQQALAILQHPRSKVVFERFPGWLAARLGVSPERLRFMIRNYTQEAGAEAA